MPNLPDLIRKYSLSGPRYTSYPPATLFTPATSALWQSAIAAGRLPIERGLRLTGEDERRRTIIMRLMCDRRLDFAALSRRLGLDFASTYAAELAALDDLEMDGLLIRTPDAVHVTPLGTPLLRVIAMRFDPSIRPVARQHAAAI